VDENLNGLVNYYGHQVELYSKFWEEMTGEKVKVSGLYFVDTNEWVNVLG